MFLQTFQQQNEQSENLIILFLLLGISVCNTKMGKEPAGYGWINFWIATFGNILVTTNIELQHRNELTFEL